MNRTKTVTVDKATVDAIASTCESQSDFVIAMHAYVYGDDWTHIKKLTDFVHCSRELANYACKVCMQIGAKYRENQPRWRNGESRPGIMLGGPWLNSGFSADDSLPPWHVRPASYIAYVPSNEQHAEQHA